MWYSVSVVINLNLQYCIYHFVDILVWKKKRKKNSMFIPVSCTSLTELLQHWPCAAPPRGWRCCACKSYSSLPELSFVVWGHLDLLTSFCKSQRRPPASLPCQSSSYTNTDEPQRLPKRAKNRYWQQLRIRILFKQVYTHLNMSNSSLSERDSSARLVSSSLRCWSSTSCFSSSSQWIR